MKKKVILGAIFIWAFFTVMLYGQDQRGGDIYFDIDAVSFRAQEDWSFVEVYVSIPRTDLHYQDTDGIYCCEFDVKIQLFLGDSLLIDKNQLSRDQIETLDEIERGQRFFKIFNFFIKEGQYKVVSSLKDLKSSREGWYHKVIKIEPYSREKLTLSDIQLSTSIVKDTSRTVFVKNGYRIIPNPSRLYGVEVPVIYCYAEVYNLSPLQTGLDSTYTLQYSIKDLDGKTIMSLPEKKILRLGNSLVEVGNVNVNSLMSGSYNLVIEVIDQGSGEQISKETNFFIYRRVDFAKQGQSAEIEGKQLSDSYGGMTEEELDEMFKYCVYLVTKQEKKSYKKLTLDGKREFMREFWKRRDTNPLTVENEFKNEFTQRIWLANQRYAMGTKEGWKTDRGRILVQYGEPNEIERYPSSMDIRPYEIWQYYEVEGGVIFIFVDIQGFGEFTLVHSTARDQLYDEDWQRWLQ